MGPVVESTAPRVRVERPPDAVARFIAVSRNLSASARPSSRSVSRAGDPWTVETPHGPVGLGFVACNDLGVLDHDVRPARGRDISNPMRVIPSQLEFAAPVPPQNHELRKCVALVVRSVVRAMRVGAREMPRPECRAR